MSTTGAYRWVRLPALDQTLLVLLALPLPSSCLLTLPPTASIAEAPWQVEINPPMSLGSLARDTRNSVAQASSTLKGDDDGNEDDSEEQDAACETPKDSSHVEFTAFTGLRGGAGKESVRIAGRWDR